MPPAKLLLRTMIGHRLLSVENPEIKQRVEGGCGCGCEFSFLHRRKGGLLSGMVKEDLRALQVDGKCQPECWSFPSEWCP